MLQTECLAHAEGAAALLVRIRFLQLTDAGTVEREFAPLEQYLDELMRRPQRMSFDFPPIHGAIDLFHGPVNGGSPPPPPPNVHVGDLDDTSALLATGWRAQVRILVENQDRGPQLTNALGVGYLRPNDLAEPQRCRHGRFR